MRKKTHQQFENELRSLRPNIKITEGHQYSGSRTPLQFQCSVGHTWRTAPTNILKGTGCPICIGKNKSLASLTDELNKIGSNLVPVETQQYKNNRTKMKFKCTNDHISYIVVGSALSGTGCAVCSKKKRKTTESFVNDLARVNPYVELVAGQNYINNKTTLKFICSLEHQWMTLPKDVLKGSRCPICSPKPYSKSAIKWLNEIAVTHSINIQHAENGGEYKIPGTLIRVDGFCMETNTVFEFYGDAFHGNPKIYASSDKCHPFNKDITAGVLYKNTQHRSAKIQAMGFALVEIWESDY